MTLRRSPLRWLRALLVALPALGLALALAALALPAGSPLARAAGAIPLAAPAGGLLSNAAEVVAAVLAVAITVVAIVVELAATRYTHQITGLFVREPANGAVMGLFVATTLLCLWVSAGGDGDAGAGRAAGATLGLVTLCLLLLLPYFAFVFAFLSPANVVDRLRVQSLRGARRAARSAPERGAAQLLEGVEELEDLALNAVQRSDRGIAVSAVGALARFLEEYAALRPELPAAWFEVEGKRELAEDPDFVSLDASERADIAEQGTWVEVKVLRQLHTLFAHAVGRVPDVPAAIALHTAALARRAAPGDPARLDLALRFMNSYMRSAVNAGDVRSAYYLLHQCRDVLEALLERGLEGRAVRMAEHLRYYGLLAYGRGQPFLAETLAYDLALVAERAFEAESPAAGALLDVLLQVDKESGTEAQETSLRGVRRAQVQLAARRLARGDARCAERIREDMRHEDRALLASVREELLTTEEPRYWEFTDRAANFAWIPPELRKHVERFFAGFEPPLPERGAAARRA